MKIEIGVHTVFDDDDIAGGAVVVIGIVVISIGGVRHIFNVVLCTRNV